MQDRETREFVTKTATFHLISDLTGRDLREIEGSMLASLDVKANGAKGKEAEVQVSGMKGTAIQAMQDVTIKKVVKEIIRIGNAPITDEAAILAFILDDLPSKEYKALIAEIETITDPKGE